MQQELELDTHQKALKINLDSRWYGTFAEIGAGQEVVRWFFRVGGAAGTVAKSMSAYDMTVSDAIYGSGDRYVSQSRCQSMLDCEFGLNLDRLASQRGDSTAFFAFADTVVARSYQGGNECHGWMGLKFQSRPHDEPSQIMIHVRMLDAEASLQQEALGIVGVNLLFGGFFLHHEPELLVESLLDKLTTGRVEIDMIEFRAKGEVLQPSEALYKKTVLVERGSFRPPTHVNFNMLECALQKIKADPSLADKEVLPIFELTMRNLLAGGKDVDRRDFLARADLLAACGMTVLISDYFEYYRLAAYLSWRTKERIGIVMGVPSLIELFDEKYYTSLPGGILESFGRLFKHNLKLFIYPLLDQTTGTVITKDTMKVAPELCKLYGYLADRGSFIDLDNYDPNVLSILSRDVLSKISKGDPSWEDMVPKEVADLIKKRCFFDYCSR